MDREPLFLETLRDLEAKILSTSDYEVLNISDLVRGLLIDGGSSLALQVNRTYNLKLQFEIAESPPLPGSEPPIFYSKQDGSTLPEQTHGRHEHS